MRSSQLPGLSTRVERLRTELAELIPCDPPTEELRTELRMMDLHDLLFEYVEWAQRLVRPASRHVVHAKNFWTARAERHRGEIESHISRLILGEDVSPFLSKRVRQHGYAPKGSDGRSVRGIDWRRRDLAVNAWGVHHLHLNVSGSEELLFIEFSRNQASLVLLGDHKSFHSGDLERAVTSWRAESGQLEIKGVIGLEHETSPEQRTTLARHGIGAFANVDGKIVLSGMLSTAGTSMEGLRHADRIIDTLERLDPKLDGGLLIENIPAEHLVRLKGRCWAWRMHHCDLLLIEETTPLSFVVVAGRN